MINCTRNNNGIDSEGASNIEEINAAEVGDDIV